MQQAGDSVLCAPFFPVCKLKGIQMRFDGWKDGPEQQFFEKFHDYGCEGDGAVVTWFGGSWFFGYRDYGCTFPEEGLWLLGMIGRRGSGRLEPVLWHRSSAPLLGCRRVLGPWMGYIG